jgi:hypothetical protein
MAKSRKSKRAKDEEGDDDDEVLEAEPFKKEEEEYDREHKAPKNEPPRKGFFQQFGEGLKAAGAEAARYTKIGITMAELEKLRFNLRSAYQRLGEAATRCWDAAPDIGISANDSDVKELVKRVNALRRQIREVEAKARDLKNNGKPEDQKSEPSGTSDDKKQ